MKLLLIASILLAAVGPAHGETDNLTMNEVDQRLMFFYSEPTNDEFEAIQLGIKANLNQFTNKAGAEMLIAVFLGKVHRKYDWPLLDIGELDDRARSIAARDDSDLSRYVWNNTQIDPGKLDVWWISFFATGDTDYLEKLIGQVGDLEAQTGTANIMVMGAANWSLAANCRRHQTVLEYTKSSLKNQPTRPNRKFIEEIIAIAEKPDG